MKAQAVAALAAVIIGVTACQPGTPPARTSVSDQATRLSVGQSVDIAGAATRLTSLRAQAGVSSTLRYSPALQAAAQAHADDLSQSGQFSHTGSDGSTLGSRLRAAGYNGCFRAENIALGQQTAGQVFNDWMQSPGHRRNMLSAQATQFGFARTGAHWVLVLGRPC